jgi:DNA-binding CsgD family transcriptional regulator
MGVRGRKPNTKFDAIIHNLTLEGRRPKNISADLGIGVDQVYRTQVRLGLRNSAKDNGIANAEYEEGVRSLAADGLTAAEIASRLCIPQTRVAKIKKKLGVAVRHASTRGPDERAFSMAALYRGGYTLQQIGDQFGVTRERVRQILSYKVGIGADAGGQAVKARKRRADIASARDQRYLEECGCTWDQYVAIRQVGRDMVGRGIAAGRTPLRAYLYQKRNAASRGIPWEMNLWQWWSIWSASGHCEDRGRGQGYVMCRKGDLGGYTLGNVFIAPARENSSEQRRKKSGLPIGVRRQGRRFLAQRHVNRQVLRLGSFPTPELAHAAYLSSVQANEVRP